MADYGKLIVQQGDRIKRLMDELAKWKADNLEITGKFTRACARIRELEAALRKYGEHSTQCNRLGVINGDCYCGFAGVLDSLDERSQSSGGTEHG